MIAGQPRGSRKKPGKSTRATDPFRVFCETKPIWICALFRLGKLSKISRCRENDRSELTGDAFSSSLRARSAASGTLPGFFRCTSPVRGLFSASGQLHTFVIQAAAAKLAFPRQHRLNFMPLPQGQGWLRPTFGSDRTVWLCAGLCTISGFGVAWEAPALASGAGLGAGLCTFSGWALGSELDPLWPRGSAT